MHPHVKHHPHRLIQVLVTMMIFQSVGSSITECSNYPSVRKVQIHSDFSKGYVRVDGRKVVASQCKDNCMDSKNFLYKVTIMDHYMLLYHLESGKFICWNPKFRKLIPRKSISNLTHCIFEETTSLVYPGYRVRYTSKDKNREVEMRFTKKGTFPGVKTKRFRTCLEKHHLSLNEIVRVDHSNATKEINERQRYTKLLKCVSPDFLPRDVDCKSHRREFCDFMYDDCHRGHAIASEIKGFCKHEWDERNAHSTHPHKCTYKY